MGDRRLIVVRDRRVAICINYKCGYATLNNNLNLNDTIEVSNPKTVRDFERFPRCRRYIFYRNPYERFLSFYKSWIASKSEASLIARKKFNFYEVIRRHGSEGLYRRFRDASEEEKLGEEMFESFLHAYEPHLREDRHTDPQSAIYRACGLGVDFFDEVLPTGETTNFLGNVFGMSVEPRNVTNSGAHKNLLANPTFIAFCNRQYENDFLDFGVPMA